MDYYVEEKHYDDNGIYYPFFSDVQSRVGKGLMTSAHIHNHIEIIYCLAGKTEAQLGSKTYIFQKGDLLLINSWEVHRIVATTDGMTKYIVVKLEPELLYTTSQSVFEAKYVLPFTLNSSEHQRLFTRDALKSTIVPMLMKEIASEYAQREYGFELSLRTDISRLFLWILRYWHEQGINLNMDSDISASSVKRLQNVFDFVEKNYQNNIGVEDAAKICSMSYTYFSHFFKSIMKRNFSDYLNSVRITAAEKLLTSTDMSITDIAIDVGFCTSSYFIYQFKLRRQISPKQYRNVFKSE